MLVLIEKEAIQSANEEINETFALTSSQITWKLDVVPEIWVRINFLVLLFPLLLSLFRVNEKWERK